MIHYLVFSKPELVSVRSASDVFEEIRLDLTDIQGEVAISVGLHSYRYYDPAIAK